MLIVTHLLEKETKGFINKLKWLNDIPEYSAIVSFDALWLYPHIPYEEGLKNNLRISLDSEI